MPVPQENSVFVEQASCLLLTMVHSGIEFKEKIPKPVTSNIPHLKYRKV
ncbi:hypothetical protein [Microcoleus sp. D3_18a_C4]